MYTLKDIKNTDPEIASAIVDEFNRQSEHIELIASENWTSEAVMSAMGSVLTNKYAEGYPAKRYYGGCTCVDVVEELARERAKELFGCEYVNVQPHSGAQANMAVQFAVLKPGDTYMGMNLDHGGHLSHGSPVNMSGKYFNCVHYGVNDDGFIDYDEVEKIALECKPKMIVAGEILALLIILLGYFFIRDIFVVTTIFAVVMLSYAFGVAIIPQVSDPNDKLKFEFDYFNDYSCNYI